MNTLADFYERLRCCDKQYFSVADTIKLYELLNTAESKDFVMLRTIARRYIKAFVSLYLDQFESPIEDVEFKKLQEALDIHK